MGFIAPLRTKRVFGTLKNMTFNPKFDFLKAVILLDAWFLKHQRPLPFRANRTPYRVWLSEIMLQQTQVKTVLPYFERFMTRFPTIFDLANAKEDEVLSLWSGLGYYSRGRNLHKTAQIIASDYEGQFPSDPKKLQKLPGIGSYTAGAILAFAFQKPHAVVDGNVSRVWSRLFNDNTPINTPFGKNHYESISHHFAHQSQNPGLTQEAIMELGAEICKPQNPKCHLCPLNTICEAYLKNTYLSLPIKQEKPKKTHMHLVCALILKNNQIYLEKNIQTGLFKGLYLPPYQLFDPNKEDPEIILKELLKKYGVKPNIEKAIQVKRTLTHRELYLNGFLIQNETLQNTHFYDTQNLKALGIPKAFLVLMEEGFFNF